MKTQPSKFDIKALDIVGAARAGVDVPIINPLTSNETGLVIRVIGAMTPAFKDDMTMLTAALFDFSESHKAPEGANKVQQAEAEIALDHESDRLTAEFLAKYTIGWQGMIENGAEVLFTNANAVRIYTEYPLIRGQVQQAMMDVSNFIKA